MTPEQEVLHDLLAQLRATDAALTDSLPLLSPFPQDVGEFEAMSTIQRVSATALLKQIEQYEDALARSFRTVLRMLGQSLKGLYAYDIAIHMIALDVLDDADAWVAVVKLRNELVHEYPSPPRLRFERLRSAYGAIPLLRNAATRLVAAVRSRRLMP